MTGFGRHRLIQLAVIAAAAEAATAIRIEAPSPSIGHQRIALASLRRDAIGIDRSTPDLSHQPVTEGVVAGRLVARYRPDLRRIEEVRHENALLTISV
jgi:hypothetical protein